MTPIGISHALEMHDYLGPTVTITGNNRSAVLSSAARARRLGGYWHQRAMFVNPGISMQQGFYTEYTITLDRIERRRGKV
jgi:hypothetical protein